jgi:hypothetical protein
MMFTQSDIHIKWHYVNIKWNYVHTKWHDVHIKWHYIHIKWHDVHIKWHDVKNRMMLKNGMMWHMVKYILMPFHNLLKE